MNMAKSNTCSFILGQLDERNRHINQTNIFIGKWIFLISEFCTADQLQRIRTCPGRSEATTASAIEFPLSTWKQNAEFPYEQKKKLWKDAGVKRIGTAPWVFDQPAHMQTAAPHHHK